MKLLFSIVAFGGCALQKANPYPKYDTGEVDSVDTGTTVEPDSTVEPDDSSTDSAVDTDSDTDTDTGPIDPNAIEIYGTYTEISGSYHYIAESSYTVDLGIEDRIYNYVVFNNAQRWLVASNDNQNGEEEVGKFSKFVWTIDASNIIWVCQVTKTADSSTAAQNVPNPSVVSMDTGCNNSAWWRLTRQ